MTSSRVRACRATGKRTQACLIALVINLVQHLLPLQGRPSIVVLDLYQPRPLRAPAPSALTLTMTPPPRRGAQLSGAASRCLLANAPSTRLVRKMTQICQPIKRKRMRREQMLARQCAKHAAGTQDDTNLPANHAQTNAPTNVVSFEHCTRHEPRAPSRSNRSAPVRLQHTFLASSREQPAVRPIEPGRGPLEHVDCRPTPTM